jgi:hypothetical protein
MRMHQPSTHKQQLAAPAAAGRKIPYSSWATTWLYKFTAGTFTAPPCQQLPGRRAQQLLHLSTCVKNHQAAAAITNLQ